MSIYCALALLLAALQTAPTTTPTAAIDDGLSTLSEIADSYPPRLEGVEQRRSAEALWHSLEAQLLAAVRADPNDYSSCLRLGDLYRMGHNLDIEDSWSKAEEQRKQAIRLRPTEPLAHFLLGQHYAGSAYPSQAKVELVRALELADEDLRPAIHHQLIVSCYQLNEFADVVRYASAFEEDGSKSPLVSFLRERAEAALRGEFRPKTITIESDGTPEDDLHVYRGPEALPTLPTVQPTRLLNDRLDEGKITVLQLDDLQLLTARTKRMIVLSADQRALLLKEASVAPTVLELFTTKALSSGIDGCFLYNFAHWYSPHSIEVPHRFLVSDDEAAEKADDFEDIIFAP
jgi:hypothetical protein